MRGWVRACGCTGVGVCFRACSLIQHATHIRHIVCGLSGSTILFDIISKTTRFSEKGPEYKMCVLIFCTTVIWNISHSKKNLATYCQMWKLLRLKYPLFVSEFSETWIFATAFEERSSNIKFHENLSTGSRVVPYGRTDMTKLTVAFRNFANATKSQQCLLQQMHNLIFI
jgi:hypothetical protein